MAGALPCLLGATHRGQRRHMDRRSRGSDWQPWDQCTTCSTCPTHTINTFGSVFQSPDINIMQCQHQKCINISVLVTDNFNYFFSPSCFSSPADLFSSVLVHSQIINPAQTHFLSPHAVCTSWFPSLLQLFIYHCVPGEKVHHMQPANKKTNNDWTCHHRVDCRLHLGICCSWREYAVKCVTLPWGWRCAALDPTCFFLFNYFLTKMKNYPRDPQGGIVKNPLLQ